MHASLMDFLQDASRPQSIHRYVLLDAQDWMTPDAARRIVARDRPHRGFARRTRDLPHRRRGFAPAAETARRSSGALAISRRQSRVFHAQDRSSIYGGFHVYARRPSLA